MKKLTRTYLLILIISAVGSISSCKKSAPYAEAGVTEVTFTFHSPEEGSTISVGEEFHVEGIIDANAMMAGWSILITDSLGVTIDEYSDLYEQTQYIFHHHIFPTSGNIGEMIITVTAFDKNMNALGSESRTVHCQ